MSLCGPLTCHDWRLLSEVKTKAPFRVPTNTRTFAIVTSPVAINLSKS